MSLQNGPEFDVETYLNRFLVNRREPQHTVTVQPKMLEATAQATLGTPGRQTQIHHINTGVCTQLTTPDLEC